MAGRGEDRPLRNQLADELVEYARESPEALMEALAELRYRCARRPRKRVRLVRQLERDARF